MRFFHLPATPEIHPLPLHDALPICDDAALKQWLELTEAYGFCIVTGTPATPEATQSRCRSRRDRKSTRLNSSHLVISYAVFCLKKKKRSRKPTDHPSSSKFTASMHT